MKSLALALALALLAPGCAARVDYDGTDYQCLDGVTCPDGYTCMAQRCVPATPPTIDAATPPAADAPPSQPDAAAVVIPTVSVAAGDFVQGCDPSIDPACPFDAFPERMVSLSAFQIDEIEVTQVAYQSCVAAGACTPPVADYDPAGTPSLPVRDVTWDQAAAYCAFAGKRLPTEAEWERAARGQDARPYPWGGTAPTCTRTNYSACGGAVLPVDTHPSGVSPVGAEDLAGNVAEWVADWYAAAYYLSAPDIDPPGPANGSERVQRGGGYGSPSGQVRAYMRSHAPPGDTDPHVGFRCAR